MGQSGRPELYRVEGGGARRVAFWGSHPGQTRRALVVCWSWCLVFSVAGLQPPLPATFPWPYPDTESCSRPPPPPPPPARPLAALGAPSRSPSLSALLRNALHRLLETLRNRSERRKTKTCAGLESNPRPLAHAPAPDAFAAARGARSTRSLAPSPLRSLISSIQTRKWKCSRLFFPRTTRSSVDGGPRERWRWWRGRGQRRRRREDPMAMAVVMMVDSSSRGSPSTSPTTPTRQTKSYTSYASRS